MADADADLLGQLTTIFADWPTSGRDEDGVPFVPWRDIVDVLSAWEKKYSDEPLIDEGLTRGLEDNTKDIQDNPCKPDQVINLIEALKVQRAQQPSPSPGAQTFTTEGDKDLAALERLRSPSSIPLPLDAEGDHELDSPPEMHNSIASTMRSSGFEMIDHHAADMSSPKEDVTSDPTSPQLDQFVFPSGGPVTAPLADAPGRRRKKTSSNPETPPRRSKKGKLIEGQGSASNVPSSWRNVRPEAPARKRRSESAGTSRAGSDTEDFQPSVPFRRAPSQPITPGPSPTASIPFPEAPNWSRPGRAPNPMNRISSAPPSAALFSSSPIDAEEPYGDDAPEEADLGYDDSFQELEDYFAGQERLADVSGEEEYLDRSMAETDASSYPPERYEPFIRYKLRELAEAKRLMHKQGEDHYEETRDLREQLEDSKAQLEQANREKNDSKLNEINLKEQVLGLEQQVASKQRALDAKEKMNLKTQKDYTDQLAVSDKYRRDITRKDEQVAAALETQKELERELEQIEQSRESTQEWAASLEVDLRIAQESAALADERLQEISRLSETNNQLKHELEVERHKNASLEKALAEARAGRVVPSVKPVTVNRLDRELSSRQLGRGTPPEGEFTDTEDLTMVEGSDAQRESGEEDSDADDEEMYTHTTVTMSKRRKATPRGQKAGSPTRVEKIETREYAEQGTQCELEMASESIQTDSETASQTIQTDLEPDRVETASSPLLSPISPSQDDSFPSTSLLPARDPSNGETAPFRPRNATQAETELERKWLFKWHEHAVVPVIGLAKGVSDEAVAEWEAVKKETGRGCSVMDQIMERSKRIGSRKVKKENKAKDEGKTSKSRRERDAANAEVEARLQSAADSDTEVEGTDTERGKSRPRRRGSNASDSGAEGSDPSTARATLESALPPPYADATTEEAQASRLGTLANHPDPEASQASSDTAQFTREEETKTALVPAQKSIDEVHTPVLSRVAHGLLRTYNILIGTDPLMTTSITLNIPTFLGALFLVCCYTSFVMYWAWMFNPYPGITYRDRRLWKSYNRYAGSPIPGLMYSGGGSGLGDVLSTMGDVFWELFGPAIPPAEPLRLRTTG